MGFALAGRELPRSGLVRLCVTDRPREALYSGLTALFDEIKKTNTTARLHIASVRAKSSGLGEPVIDAGDAAWFFSSGPGAALPRLRTRRPSSPISAIAPRFADHSAQSSQTPS